MVAIKRGVKIEGQDAVNIRDLIVPGVGNRRIFRILLTNACRFSCDYCPMRAERDLPRHALAPASLARLFMTAFRRGWCDGLFVTSGIPKDPIFAMEQMLQLVEILRFTHGYRGYLHAKALAGAEPGQIERLVRLVDRVSYNLEAPCQRALDEHAAGKSGASGLSLLETARDAALAVREARRASARHAPAPLPASLPAGPTPGRRGPALALVNSSRFPVELSTATREELRRVPGVGPRTVERILETRSRRALRDPADLKRLGVQLGRAGGFVTLRGRLVGTRSIQTLLFANCSTGETYKYSAGTF